MKNNKKLFALISVGLALTWFLLMVPDSSPDVKINQAGSTPFAWSRDDLWNSLEKSFREAREADAPQRNAQLDTLKSAAESMLAKTEGQRLAPGDTVFDALAFNFFAMAPIVAAGPEHLDWYMGYYTRVRKSVKRQSQRWEMSRPDARNTIYRILYGMRAATEEVLLQSPRMTFNPALFVTEEPSATPSARVFGITVHSGDLLLSRGGAVVSALISRGNDYPGNFSHVALVYVDALTGTPYLVEAHIERGVAVSNMAQYVADKKLRFMVMRTRADLPLLAENPQIPQEAAKYMYRTALSRHIPYDFRMDFRDSSAMFCSEVGAAAYHRFGIDLWQAVSTISSPGVERLLNEFGVENFVTMMPSDLEYDPQLAVVAEWRDPQTLFKDHIYNAVMDVLLENASKNDAIPVNPWMLPVARVAKAWSLLLNLFNREGPVPEGMNATQGLKNNAFEEMHEKIRRQVEEKAWAFLQKNGYIPPYWQLIRMANESMAGSAGPSIP